MRKKVLTALLISGTVYLTLLLALVVFEKKAVFQGKLLAPDFHFDFPGTWAERRYQTAPGVRLSALYFRTDSVPRRGVVLYLHGNRDNLARWGRHAPDFTRRGYDVLMPDYREYGKSTGRITTEAELHADMRFIYKALQREIPQDSLVVYGRSLGSGLATRLAAENNPRLLLLETPYFNLPDVGWSHLPLFPYARLSRFSFRTDEWIRRVRCPIHLFHGTADSLVPYSHSLRLAAKLKRNPAEILTTIPGGGHKNLATFATYQAALDRCLIR